MVILQSARFGRSVKKLHPNQKKLLDKAIRKISLQPKIGQAKVGDLAGEFQMFQRRPLQHGEVRECLVPKLGYMQRHAFQHGEISRAAGDSKVLQRHARQGAEVNGMGHGRGELQLSQGHPGQR